jgi:hypothetical protein
MSERDREPVQVPADVLEGLEAVRRHLGHNVLDVATIRYFANERGRRALAIWIHRCPEEYGRGLRDGSKPRARNPLLGGGRTPAQNRQETSYPS